MLDIPDNRLRIIKFACMIAMLSLASCAGNGDTTIVLPENEPEISSITANPNPSGSTPGASIPTYVIPKSIQTEIKAHSKIYEGSTPPDIQGCYLISPMKMTYSNIPSDSVGTTFTPMTICFFASSRTNIYSYTEIEGTSSGSSDSVHVIGSGNNFTAYFTASGYSSDIYNTHAVIISGTKVSTGIRDISYTFTMVSKGADPTPLLVPVGSIRTAGDSDRLAENASQASARSTAKSPPTRSASFFAR